LSVCALQLAAACIINKASRGFIVRQRRRNAIKAAEAEAEQKRRAAEVAAAQAAAAAAAAHAQAELEAAAAATAAAAEAERLKRKQRLDGNAQAMRERARLKNSRATAAVPAPTLQTNWSGESDGSADRAQLPAVAPASGDSPSADAPPAQGLAAEATSASMFSGGTPSAIPLPTVSTQERLVTVLDVLKKSARVPSDDVLSITAPMKTDVRSLSEVPLAPLLRTPLEQDRRASRRAVPSTSVAAASTAILDLLGLPAVPPSAPTSGRLQQGLQTGHEPTALPAGIGATRLERQSSTGTTARPTTVDADAPAPPGVHGTPLPAATAAASVAPLPAMGALGFFKQGLGKLTAAVRGATAEATAAIATQPSRTSSLAVADQGSSLITGTAGPLQEQPPALSPPAPAHADGGANSAGASPPEAALSGQAGGVLQADGEESGTVIDHMQQAAQVAVQAAPQSLNATSRAVAAAPVAAPEFSSRSRLRARRSMLATRRDDGSRAVDAAVLLAQDMPRLAPQLRALLTSKAPLRGASLMPANPPENEAPARVHAAASLLEGSRPQPEEKGVADPGMGATSSSANVTASSASNVITGLAQRVLHSLTQRSKLPVPRGERSELGSGASLSDGEDETEVQLQMSSFGPGSAAEALVDKRREADIRASLLRGLTSQPLATVQLVNSLGRSPIVPLVQVSASSAPLPAWPSDEATQALMAWLHASITWGASTGGASQAGNTVVLPRLAAWQRTFDPQAAAPRASTLLPPPQPAHRVRVSAILHVLFALRLTAAAAASTDTFVQAPGEWPGEPDVIAFIRAYAHLLNLDVVAVACLHAGFAGAGEGNSEGRAVLQLLLVCTSFPLFPSSPFCATLPPSPGVRAPCC
jgi:hypothetical protein